MDNLIEFQSRTRVLCGEGALERLGALAAELGFRRPLLVADPGIVRAGHVERATRLLTAAGLEVVPFHDFDISPTSDHVEAGRAFAEAQRIDSLIGLGGGSSLDCAKAINFVLTNGGVINDYRGYGLATRAPLLPMIGVPTTAGTGSEAQSYALISDARTHARMACGDPGAAFRVALLDPRLLTTQPREVRAAAGLDAISHAIETRVTRRRNFFSDGFSRQAWRLLGANFERVLSHSDDLAAWGAMQLGAYFAGAAIECSMLGAAHACANPLTARYGTVHGVAVTLVLPAVVRWNASVAADDYAEFLAPDGRGTTNPEPGEALARRLEEMAAAGGLPTRLSAAGIPEDDLPALAEEAGKYWTGQFNPRAWDVAGALEVYRCAY